MKENKKEKINNNQMELKKTKLRIKEIEILRY